MINQVGERIRAIRESKKLTQANMAEELGMTTSAYSKIERNSINIPLNRLFQIAEILEINIADLFEEKIPSTPKTITNCSFATKDDIKALSKSIDGLSKKIELLQGQTKPKLPVDTKPHSVQSQKKKTKVKK